MQCDESSDLNFCLAQPHPSRDHWAPLPPIDTHTQLFRLIVPHHLVTPNVVSCKKTKFASSYCQEMTNVTFFMRRIKNSKDLFPSLHSETQGKKTSLNNGWEKGLLRKESRCGVIEQWGGGTGDAEDNIGEGRKREKGEKNADKTSGNDWLEVEYGVWVCTEDDVTWCCETRCSHSLRHARPGHSHKARHSGQAHDQVENHAAFPSTEPVCWGDAAGNVPPVTFRNLSAATVSFWCKENSAPCDGQHKPLNYGFNHLVKWNDNCF